MSVSLRITGTSAISLFLNRDKPILAVVVPDIIQVVITVVYRTQFPNSISQPITELCAWINCLTAIRTMYLGTTLLALHHVSGMSIHFSVPQVFWPPSW